MSMFIEAKANTEVGEVDLVITQKDHVSVQGKPVIRGVRYTAHLHVYLIDGKWSIRTTESQYIKRAWDGAGRNNRFNESAAPTFCAKITGEYVKAVADFAAKNPQLFVDAERTRLEREIALAESKIADLRKGIDGEEKALKALKVQLATIP